MGNAPKKGGGGESCGEAPWEGVRTSFGSELLAGGLATSGLAGGLLSVIVRWCGER